MDTSKVTEAIEGLTATVTGSMKQVDDRLAAHEARLNRLDRFGSANTTTDGQRFVLPGPAELKTMRIADDPGGGYIVNPSIAPMFFDRLRPASVVLGSGVRTFVLENSDTLRLPGLSASTTVQRTGEGGTISESDLTLRSIDARAKKYAIRSVCTSEWLDDSSPSGRDLVTSDHIKQLAAAVDIDFLIGSDQAGILGMANWPDVEVTTLGTGAGATITLDHVEGALYRLEKANANLNQAAIFCHPRTWSTLRLERDQYDRYMLQPDPTEPARRSLFGVPVHVTTQLPVNEVVGGSQDCSRLIVIDTTQVAVVRRQELVILIDPYTMSSTDKTVVQSKTRMGLAILNSGAVQVLAGARP